MSTNSIAEYLIPSNVSTPNHDRANATLLFLCRNSDVHGVVSSIQQLEDRFNRKHGYPWVLLNEEPFTEDFKQCVAKPFPFLPILTVQGRRIRVLTDSPVHFGVIPPQHWYQPDWINEDLARRGRLRMMEQGIIYGGT